MPIRPTEHPPIVAIEAQIARYEHQEPTVDREPDSNEPYQKSAGSCLLQEFALIVETVVKCSPPKTFSDQDVLSGVRGEHVLY